MLSSQHDERVSLEQIINKEVGVAMKEALRRIIRPAIKQLRTSANKAGYDIVRIPQSGSNSERAPEVYFNSLKDKADVKYIEPVTLRNLVDPDETTINTYMSLFLGRIGNIDSRHNFPILGQGDKSASVRERVLSYVSGSRVSQYVSVLNWCMKCGIDLDGVKVIDVGTGVGMLPFILGDKWRRADIVACDANRDYIDIASALFPEMRFICQPLSSVCEKYDVVFFTEILEHIADPYHAVDELRRIVSSMGKIILTVPDGRCDQMESMSFIKETGSYGGHVNFWSIESWFSFLQHAFLPAKIWVGCKSGSNLFACVEPTRP
jgi:2-polyprenyl-3-methyl-5-hydroxy-6-metoxy-1,4-benzoquinol methylase